MEKAYEGHMRWDDLVFNSSLLQQYYRPRFGLHRHNTASEIRTVVGEDYWKKSWTFSVVRHPAQRLESFYKWCHRRCGGFKEKLAPLNEEEKKKQLFNEKIFKKRLTQRMNFVDIFYVMSRDFSEFIDRILFRDESLWGDQINNDIIGDLSEKMLLSSQFNSLSEKGELIVDDYFKLEEIGKFWPIFSEKTGLSISSLHENKGQSLSKEEFSWAPRQKEALFKIFEKDFEVFSYQP